MLTASEAEFAMKPTSEQTRNATLSAVPFPEELLILEGSFRNTAVEPTHTVAAPHPTTLDPSLAYGCVDWYIYPDSKPESVAA
jgi:hypothetical protein